MIYPIFVIKDNKIGYMTPTIDNNEQTAVRRFHMSMISDDSVIKVHAEDFALYKIVGVI